MTKPVEKLHDMETVSEVLLKSKAYFGAYVDSEGFVGGLWSWGDTDRGVLLKVIGRLDAMKLELLEAYNKDLGSTDLVGL